jgi:hypothetical protein
MLKSSKIPVFKELYFELTCYFFLPPALLVKTLPRLQRFSSLSFALASVDSKFKRDNEDIDHSIMG